MSSAGVGRGTTHRRVAPLTFGVLVEAPLIVVGFYIWLIGIHGGWQMQDFAAMRSGAAAVLHARSPYPPPDAVAIADAKQLVYPPLVAYLFVPFALVPYALAAPIYFFVLLAALPATLYLLDVRDWRCYGAVLLWYPLAGSLGVGAISPLLALLVALVWRFRERARLTAVVAAAAIAAKLFLWPLPLWLAATRRWRGALLTGAATVAVFLIPFAGLGMSTLLGYGNVLRKLNDVFGPTSFSGVVLLRAVGVAHTHALIAVVLVGGALLLAMRRTDDRAALTLAILVSLLVSPIVWMHYYVLLAVPIALARPRLSVLWFLPLGYWLAPGLESEGKLWRLVVGIGVTIAIAMLAAQSSSPKPQQRLSVARPADFESPAHREAASGRHDEGEAALPVPSENAPANT
jgi:hypothetical protein